MRFGSTVPLPLPPPNLLLFLHVGGPLLSPRHISKSKGFITINHLFISCFISAGEWTNNQGCSLGYPRFLFLPEAVCRLPIYVQSALRSQEEGVEADLLLLQEPSTLWHRREDWKSKHGLSPHHYQMNNVVLGRQPGTNKTRGNPCLCSVWQAVTAVKYVHHHDI